MSQRGTFAVSVARKAVYLAGFCGALIGAGVLGVVGCSSAGDEGSDGVHAAEPENEGHAIGQVALALAPGDSVQKVTDEAPCNGDPVRGLATQLIEEVQCIKPGTMKRIDNLPGIRLDGNMAPWLQTPAADALIAAQQARGATIEINSALRALPEQYSLRTWFERDLCYITAAATPGRSNHERGLAIDIDDYSSWRSALESNGFRWLGAGDVVHFDYVGGGTVDLANLSILSFQRLWNRNHPEDVIEEDGIYGPMTNARLAASPSGGFAKGALTSCPPPEFGGPVPEVDAGAPPPPRDAGNAEDAGDDFYDDFGMDDRGGCRLSRTCGSSGPSHEAATFLLTMVTGLVIVGRRAKRRQGPRPHGS